MKSFGLIVFLSCIFYLEALKFDNPKSDILPTKEVCGHQEPGDHSASEFPWVVYLPLQTRTYNPQANVRCAGVLISKRYVAIAKTCLQFVLTKVHVGQYDTSKHETCDNSDCVIVEEINIEDRVIDENLNVVLLRLAKDVEFTKFVKPICLPFEELKRAELGDTVYSSGWGLKTIDVENSLTKKIVKEIVVNNEDCKKVGHFVNAKDLGDYICVKKQEDSTHNPCSGDEGSPIMYSSNGQWVLEGVMMWLFDSKSKPCTISEPAGGVKITEQVLQWIVDKIHA